MTLFCHGLCSRGCHHNDERVCSSVGSVCVQILGTNHGRALDVTWKRIGG